MAYSSISHAGFILLALACAYPVRMDMASGEVVAFYLAAYLPMTMAAFFVLCIVRSSRGEEEISVLDGLGKRSPFLAFVLLVSVMGLAGIPLTVGFLGKLYVFQAALDQGHFVLLAIATLGAAAGFYYYFKVVRSMYWNAPSDQDAIAVGTGSRVLLALLAAAIIFLGLNQGIILGFLR